MAQNQRYEWLVKAVAEHKSDECLLWPFRIDRDGYGRLRPPVELFGRTTVAAHRLAFKIVNGRWPEPCGLHSCDTPGCCNVRHISEGTHQVNQHQKADRGRSLRGVQQHSAKLDPVSVEYIRSVYRRRRYGDVQRMALHYGVTRRIIRLVGTGKLWRHV